MSGRTNDAKVQSITSQVEGSRADLEQQRRHDEEVVPAHQTDLDIRTALAKLLQVAGGEDPTEAATEDQDPSFRSGWICTGYQALVAQYGYLAQGLLPRSERVLTTVLMQTFFSHCVPGCPAAARSVNTKAWSWLTRPAGIDSSPARGRPSILTFSLPVTSHKIRRERLRIGYVNVIRLLPW